MSIQSEINRIAGAKSDIADAIEDQGVTVPSGTKLDGMANLIGQISGGSGKLNSTQAADAYDPTATYAVGDKVSYAGNVYSCISAISTPETWDSTHWDQVDPIQDQVDDVRNTLNHVEDGLAIIVEGNTCTSGASQGQYVYLKDSTITGYADGLYTAAQAIPANTTIDGTYLTAVSDGGLNSLNDKIAYIKNTIFIDLGAVADLTGINNLKTPGVYTCYFYSDTGIPYPGWGVLIVGSGALGDHVEQAYISYGGTCSRYYEGGSWSSWSKVAFS